MSKLCPEGLDETLRAWVESQPVCFVATAPGADGHLNAWPTGYDELDVVLPSMRGSRARKNGTSIDGLPAIAVRQSATTARDGAI